MLHPHDFRAVIGDPAKRALWIYDFLDALINSQVLEDAHRPIVDCHSTGSLIDILLTLQRNHGYAFVGEGQRADQPCRAIADDGDVSVVGLGGHVACLLSSQPLVPVMTLRSSML